MAAIERWEPCVSRYENILSDTLDDEIKLAGLEDLVPEELEKHLILNSDRLRTFEGARLEIVTYTEAKFGVRIRDSRPGDTVTRGQSDSKVLMRSVLAAGKYAAIGHGKGKYSGFAWCVLLSWRRLVDKKKRRLREHAQLSSVFGVHVERRRREGVADTTVPASEEEHKKH